MKIKTKAKPFLPNGNLHKSRGIGTVEYTLVTAVMSAVLLTPFTLEGEDESSSAIRRIINAVQQEHSGYMYVASIPTLPHTDGWISSGFPSGNSTGGGGNNNPGTGGNPVTNPPGTGTPPTPGPGGPGTPSIGGGTGPVTPPIGGGGNPPGGSPGGIGGLGSPGGVGGAGGITGPGGIGNPSGPIAGPVTGPGGPIPIGSPSGPGGPNAPVFPGFPTGPGNPPGTSPLPLGPDGPDFGNTQCNANTPASPSGLFPGFSNGGIQTSSSPNQPSRIASTQVGNPIHVVTGNKYQQEADLPVLPGGLSFTRHYNSRDSYTGALGPGWRHNYETNLVDQGNRVFIWQSDGRRIDFTLTHKDQYHTRHFKAAQHSDGTLMSSDFLRWQWADGTLVTFTAQGRLHSQADPNGRITYYDHNPRGQVTQIIDPDQRKLRLTYDNNGRLLGFTGPGGEQTSYKYDARHNLAQVIYADKTTRQYHYEDPHDAHNLTGITDETNTRTASWAYDAQDRGILSTHADNVGKVTLNYLPGQTQVTDSQGQISTYTTASHNAVPYVTAVYGPGCSTCGVGDVGYEYNDKLQLTRVTHKDGSSNLNEYDTLSRLTAMYIKPANQPAELIARFEYVGDTQQITRYAAPSINPDGERQVRIRYNTQNQPLEIIQTGYAPTPQGSYTPITRSHTLAYDKQGQLITIDGARSDVKDITRLIWNKQGHVAQTLLPDGGSLKILDKDATGRVTQLQVDNSTPLTIEYTRAGGLAAISNKNGRLKFVKDPAKPKPAQIVKGPGKAPTIRLGGPSQAPAKTPSAFQSLPAQSPRLPSIQPVSLEPKPQPASPAKLANTSHDPLKIITDPNGNPTYYGLDDFGRQVFILSPDTGLTEYTYDPANNLLSKTVSSGHTAAFAYDVSNRLIQADVSGHTTDFQWSEPGDGPIEPAIRQITTPTHKHTTKYDPQGRVVATTQTLGKHSYTTDYAYNQQGQLTHKTLPDGTRLNYTYNNTGPNAGTLQAITIGPWYKSKTPLITGLNDEPPGSNSIDWQAPNGLTTTLTQEANRLSAMQLQGHYDLRYTYGQNNQITGIANLAKIQQRYCFDENGRLDLAITPDALYGYHYDANGNRTRLVLNGKHISYKYHPGNNHLAAIEAPQAWQTPLKFGWQTVATQNPEPNRTPTQTETTTIDATGNLTHLAGLSIDYTPNGQPEHLYRNNKKLATYHYNSRAQRISKTLYNEHQKPQSHHYYLYENTQLTGEANEQGKITRQYHYLGHHPVAILEGKTRYSVHTNHLGAPIAVTDETQTLIWQAHYAPFGAAFINDDPDKDGNKFTLNLRLPGQYEDSESGLYYNHHRYYDPSQGRYISSDPLGLVAGFNTYAYAANDPVNNIDPTGLLLFAFDGTGNSNPARGRSDISNVVKFHDTYHDQEGLGFPAFYIAGPGTQSFGPSRTGDAATGESIIDRIAEMGRRFIVYFDFLKFRNANLTHLDIDVIGFSRGAASARVFANLVDAFLRTDNLNRFTEDDFILEHSSDRRFDFTTQDAMAAREYIQDNCLTVNLRFLGLWDTVPHYQFRQSDDLEQLNLRIPVSAQSAAHAVAANEDRRDFHGISIHEDGRAINLTGNVRLERGFIGAHSDIGGGYAEGDLSDVALMWMVQQAESAGATFNRQIIEQRNWDEVTSPVLHDSLGVFPFHQAGRDFKYVDNVSRVRQRQWTGFGMDHATSQNFFDERYITTCGSGRSRRECKSEDSDGSRTLVGMISDQIPFTYSDWLLTNYQLDIDIRIDPRQLQADGRPSPTRP